MSWRRGKGWGAPVLTALVLASACVSAGCGSSGSVTGASSESAAVENPAALTTPVVTDRPNLPSADVMATLEGRLAAMNRGDGAAAAAFYTDDGILEETDLTPHLVSRGRAELAARFNDLYSLGLRLAAAGAPVANDRYVAEPTRFYNGNEPGRGAGMLIFEIAAGSRLAHQWMIGWAAGPEKTWSILKSPSADQPNLPPPRVAKVLTGLMAAIDRGDGRVAASYYAEGGVQEELDDPPSRSFKGREAVAGWFEDFSGHGLRLASAGSPITYDVYVAQPVRFFRAHGAGRGAGMLVLQFDPAYRIAHGWIIGRMSDTPDESVNSAPAGTTSGNGPGGGPGKIAFTPGAQTGPDNVVEPRGTYLVNADGTWLQPPVGETDARNPARSPEGSRLAFFDHGIVSAADEQALSPAMALWTPDADGHRLKKIPHAAAGSDPVWRQE